MSREMQYGTKKSTSVRFTTDKGCCHWLCKNGMAGRYMSVASGGNAVNSASKAIRRYIGIDAPDM